MTLEEYKTCQGIAAGVCRSWHASELQEDATQETAIHYWRAKERFDPSKGHDMGFARKRLKGAAKDFIRTWRETRRESKMGVTVIPETSEVWEIKAEGPDTVELHFQKAETKRMLAKLDGYPRHKELVIRYFLHEEPLRSIGASFGVNESRAAQIKNAAIKKMRAGE
jgi:RNA polymerase sigma factor (sigma-70 family)